MKFSTLGSTEPRQRERIDEKASLGAVLPEPRRARPAGAERLPQQGIRSERILEQPGMRRMNREQLTPRGEQLMTVAQEMQQRELKLREQARRRHDFAGAG